MKRNFYIETFFYINNNIYFFIIVFNTFNYFLFFRLIVTWKMKEKEVRHRLDLAKVIIYSFFYIIVFTYLFINSLFFFYHHFRPFFISFHKKNHFLYIFTYFIYFYFYYENFIIFSSLKRILKYFIFHSSWYPILPLYLFSI